MKQQSMKPHKLAKKLTLSKETIRDLSAVELSQVAGGAFTQTPAACESVTPRFCPSERKRCPL